MFFSQQRDSVPYEPLEEKNDAEASPYTREPPSSRLAIYDLRFNFWTLLAGIFATTTVVLSVLLYTQHIGLNYEHGFATELGLLYFPLVGVLKQ
jgi:hypothetical protein